MKATLEPIAYTLRIHESPEAKLGDEYFAAMTITVDDEKCATMRGFVPGAVSKEAMRAAFDVMLEADITHCLYTRKYKTRDGQVRTKRVKMDLKTQQMTVSVIS